MLTSDNKNGVKKWDEYAWQVLYESNYNKVYKAAYSIILDAEMAEEITQITFMKAFININQLRDKEKFIPWICKIAVNVARDMLKQKIAERNKIISLYDDEGNMKEYIEELINFKSPEDEYEISEVIDSIIGCVNDLSSDDKTILHLKYIEGYTYEEISELMNINRNTIGTKILRTKKKISLELNKIYRLEAGG